MKRLIALIGLALMSFAPPAAARQEAFAATLSGHSVTSNTGSNATGSARIVIDTEARWVDITLTVDGISREGLWDTLVKAPMGPIHLHLYPSPDLSQADGVVLVFPLPFGENYRPTKAGFEVRVRRLPYALGAKILSSQADFDTFHRALESGAVVLDVHTNAFHDGEISGKLTPVKS